MKEKEPNKTKKTLATVFIIIFALAFIIFGAIFIKKIIDTKRSEDTVDEVKQLIEDEEEEEEPLDLTVSTDTDSEKGYVEIDGVKIQKKYARLYRNNKDYIGWIKISDTKIDYPVMQSMYNEQYYIDKDYNKEYSYAGTLFIDLCCDVKEGDNVIIYGHNMQTGTMFHDLMKYEKEDFYKEHKTFTFNTIYEDGEYEVIAVFRTKLYDGREEAFKYYEFYDAENEEEFDYYVTNCKELTPYEIKESAKYGDRLLTLSTCAYHTKNGRFVVVAKKISE